MPTLTKTHPFVWTARSWTGIGLAIIAAGLAGAALLVFGLSAPGLPSSEPPVIKAGVIQSDGSSQIRSGETLSQSQDDHSALYVSNGSRLKLTGAYVATSGNTTSLDQSSFFGLNAAVLAGAGGVLTLIGGTIETTGTGANGGFASGDKAELQLNGTRISAAGDGAHGVMATLGGVVTLQDVHIETTGQRSAAMATDRGGGSLSATGGSAETHGSRSPVLYSTGSISISGMQGRARNAEAAVVEGSNSILVLNSDLSAAASSGVMIYQSFSGDAQGQEGRFTMTGGLLDVLQGPAFYATNTNALFTLTDVAVTAHSGILLKASADSWGAAGANGGRITLVANRQILTGDVVTDAVSSITLQLAQKSVLHGAINVASLSLDASSQWQVTGDSRLSVLADPLGLKDGMLLNIIGNGHTVTYDPKLPDNGWLGGRAYALTNGGNLLPELN